MKEFAPIYSQKEKFFISIKWLVLSAAIALIFIFFIKPYFMSLGSCTSENYSKVEFLIYCLYVGLPGFLFLIVFLFEGVRSIKIIKCGVSPLPMEKVFYKKKYTYGWRARIKPIFMILFLFVLLFIAINGFNLAESNLISVCNN